MATYNPSTVTNGTYVSPQNPVLGGQGYGTKELFEGGSSSFFPQKPAELLQLYFRSNRGVPASVLWRATGRRKVTDTTTTGHYEVDRERDLIGLGAISGGGGAGQDVTVPVAATSMLSVSSGALSGVLAAPIKVGDVIQLQDAGKTQAFVKSISKVANPWVLTLRPTVSTIDLTGKIVANTEYMIIGNYSPEGSGLPAGTIKRFIKYSNTFATIKNALRKTGDYIATKSYFDTTGQNTSIFELDMQEMLLNHEYDKTLGLFFGKQFDNITVDSDTVSATYPQALDLGDLPVSGTEGLVPWAETYGFNDTYVPGLYTLENLYDITAYIRNRRLISTSWTSYQGFRANQQVERVVRDTVGQLNAGIKIGMVEGSAEGVELNFNFSSTTIGGIDFMFKVEEVFNDNLAAGAAGYPYPDYMIFLPDASTTQQGNPSFSYWYEVRGRMGAEYENAIVTQNGTPFLGNQNLTQDILIHGLQSKVAFHGACPNNVIVQKP